MYSICIHVNTMHLILFDLIPYLYHGTEIWGLTAHTAERCHKKEEKISNWRKYDLQWLWNKIASCNCGLDKCALFVYIIL